MVGALVVIAALALTVAVLAGYVERAFVDSDQFANRAGAALQDERAREAIATRVTDDLVLAQQQDLVAARPLIESAVSGVIGGGAFGGLFRSSIRDVHRSLVDENAQTVTLTLADVGLVVSEALVNVTKHAAGASARVEITVDDGTLVVRVDDDGPGRATVGGGTGLMGLVDRARAVGGTLEVDSRPGVGTTVLARIPIAQP